MAPRASHITVNPYQEVHLPHGTHMTPLYLGENRAQHKTQTGGRPLQPCWLPVSLPAAACLQLPQVTASRCLSPARQVCPSFTRGSALLTRFPGSLPSLAAPPPLSTSWLRPVGSWIMEEAASRTVDSPAWGRQAPLLPPNAG